MKTNVAVVQSIKLGLLALAGLGFAADAMAYTCANLPYAQGSAQFSSYSACGALNTQNTQSTYVTSNGTLEVVASQMTSMILDRIDEVRGKHHGHHHHYHHHHASADDVLDDENNGMSAGWHKDTGLWINGVGTLTDNDFNPTSYHGNYYNFMVGLDRQINSSMTLGLGVGFETSKVNTYFNNGEQENNGWTVIPYVAYEIGDGLMFDMNVGYNWSDYSLERHDPLSPTFAYTAEPDARRWSAGMNLSKDCQWDKYLLTSHASVFWARERIDRYTEVGTSALTPEQTTKVGRLSIGGTAGYEIGHWAPYVLGNLLWDFAQDSVVIATSQSSTQPANDSTGVELGVGLALEMGHSFTGHIEGKTEVARDNIERRSANVAIRWDL